MSAVVEVGLGARAYEVRIGPGLLAAAGDVVRPLLARPKLAVVTDETVHRIHGTALLASLERAGVAAEVIVLPPGEEQKSFAGLERLCLALLDAGLERTDLVLAFGGGVIGDLAGFAAAILKRGAPFVQIPTTLLAQVDSSVGGKTAIDTPQGKNLLGVFHQPRLVLADVEVLSTLPARERRCGFAEVLKYGLLGDAPFFAWLEANGAGVLAGETGLLVAAVRRCVEMKAQIVAEDEREGGRRALLNLGHTFGHALEAATGFGDRLKHGEAVAIGCALAFRYAARIGVCPQEDAAQVGQVLDRFGLPTRLSEAGGGPLSAEALIEAMGRDKKSVAGAITLILPRRIGEAVVCKGADETALRSFLVEVGAAP